MKRKGNILIIDDNEEILFSLKVLLSKDFDNIITLNSPKQVPNLLRTQKFDVYILDMNFTAEIQSGNEGFFWMKEILNHDTDAIIIFITAFAGIELAVKAIKEGATDFIEKPWDNRKLLTTVINAFNLRKSRSKITLLEKKHLHLQKDTFNKTQIVKGNSVSMKKVNKVVDKVSKTDANVLVFGENGTGKQVIAYEIHNKSHRKNASFVSIDMGAIPESLFESELFGHVKGAFTDATEDRMGKIELASGGTLFLDEIGNLPLNLQSKLLTVLQTRTLNRLGSNDPVEVDIRLISASNQNLNELSENGQFRVDLLYRINTVQIDLPPLRERKADIKPMINFFLNSLKSKYNKPDLLLTESAFKKLVNYDWPGNVRQLKHTIENLVILSEKETISSADVIFKSSVKKNTSKISANFYENEKEHIKYVLDRNKGHLSKSANELGIARTTLYRKIEKYDL